MEVIAWNGYLTAATVNIAFQRRVRSQNEDLGDYRESSLMMMMIDTCCF